MSEVLRVPDRHDIPLPQPLETPVAPLELASAILDSLADAVVVYDAAGRLVGGNPAAGSLLHLELPGRTASLAIPIAERKGGLDLLTLEGQPLPREKWPAVRVLRGEKLAGANTVDVVARTLDGQERVLNISGAPLLNAQGQVEGAVCMLRDITQRKQLERELAMHVAELESIFATQVEGVVFADTTGSIVRMNEAQRRILVSRGVNPDAESIETWAQETAPRDAMGRPIPIERLPFYRALRGETVTDGQAVELYQRTPDGEDLVLLVSGAPVRDSQGRVLGVVLTTYDVTQQRRLEQQRLDIMRVVAHDLANPVAAVRLYIQTQQRRLAQGQPAFVPDDELLSQMDHGLTRMQRLLDDLRVATKAELGTLDLQRERRDLCALCREEAAAQQAISDRTVRVETPPQPVWTEIDRERIGQVIANLLTNAHKYSPVDRPVDVTVRIAGGNARVEVRDAGPGIPTQDQPHVFDKFHRAAGIEARDRSGGLGLGLYISKVIVTQHGGEIGVESAVGTGSTFWFSVPLAPEHS